MIIAANWATEPAFISDSGSLKTTNNLIMLPHLICITWLLHPDYFLCLYDIACADELLLRDAASLCCMDIVEIN